MHDMWLAAAGATRKSRAAYAACLEKKSKNACAAEKRTADEALRDEARSSRDAIFADLEAFFAKTALDSARAEIEPADKAHQAAMKALKEAMTAHGDYVNARANPATDPHFKDARLTALIAP